MKRTPFKTLFLGTLALVLFVASVSIVTAYDWTPPSLPFPSGNPAPPIDSSTAPQRKDGDFFVGITDSNKIGLTIVPVSFDGKLVIEKAGKQGWVTFLPGTSVITSALLLNPGVGINLTSGFDEKTKLHVNGATRTNELAVGATPNTNARAFFFSNTTTAGRSLGWFSQQSPVPAGAAITGVSISNSGSTAAANSQAIGLNVTANGTGLGRNIAGYFFASNANPSGKARAIVAVGGIEADAYYLTGGGSLGAGGGGWSVNAIDEDIGYVYLTTSTYAVGIGTDIPLGAFDLRSDESVYFKSNVFGKGSVNIGEGGSVSLNVSGNVVVGGAGGGAVYSNQENEIEIGPRQTWTQANSDNPPLSWFGSYASSRMTCDSSTKGIQCSDSFYPAAGNSGSKHDLFAGEEKTNNALPCTNVSGVPNGNCFLQPKAREFTYSTSYGGKVIARAGEFSKYVDSEIGYFTKAIQISTSTGPATLWLGGAASGGSVTGIWAGGVGVSLSNFEGAPPAPIQKWFAGLDSSGVNFEFQQGGFGGPSALTLTSNRSVYVPNTLGVGVSPSTGNVMLNVRAPSADFSYGTLITAPNTKNKAIGVNNLSGKDTFLVMGDGYVSSTAVASKSFIIKPQGSINVQAAEGAVPVQGYVITGACTYEPSGNGRCREAALGGITFGNISNSGLGVIRCPANFTLRKGGTSGAWAFCTYP